MKLLIIDDNAQMRQMIGAIVTDLVDQVVECEDGDEVVAAYAAHHFTAEDLALMDLQMQRVSGLEATQRLRQVYPEARVIIVTRYDDAHWRAAAHQAGACGYVLKENLIELRRWLQSSP